MAESSKKKAQSKNASSPESSLPSDPLPSRVPGTSSGGGIYIVGALVLAAGIAALLFSRCGEETKPAPEAQVVPTAAPPPVDLPKFSPPPPPEEEEEDAGAKDEGEKKAASADSKTPAPASGGGGACAQCGQGVVSSALQTAVMQTGGLARGCYNRALRQGGAEGSIMVSVSVGAEGNLCGARITSDSVGNPGLTQCVLSKFQSRSYPKPERGCVVLNVPISFSMKQ